MNRSRVFLLVALTVAVGGCGAASTTSPTTSTTTPSPVTQSSPSAVPVSPAAATPIQAPITTPIPTLASTTELASAAPAGAISVRLARPDGQPRFQPDHATAKAGTVVFFLQNIPGAIGAPDHNMRIEPAVGRLLAASPTLRANDAVTFTVNGLTSGSYVFWCSVIGLDGQTHAVNGMVGTLTITP